MRRAIVATAGIALLAGACAREPAVQRAYGGNVIVGAFVEPEAYASVLRGAIAEAGGHWPDALQAYEEAAARAPRSPEVWTRIGEVRCQANPRDASADAAIDHALRLDAEYARAWSARARCDQARGDAAGANAAAARAAEIDPAADGANVLLARADGHGAPGAGHVDVSTRERLVALTATARDPVVAWGALATWSEARGDVALWSRALVELARRSPSKRDSIAGAAEALAGAGALGEARAVAAAALDAAPEPMGPGRGLAVRLAVDEAIARHDVDSVRARTTRGRLPLDEAAGRALLAGETTLARTLADEEASADPASRGARLVRAAVSGGDLVAAASDPRSSDSRPSAAALVAFEAALARSVPPARAIAALRSLEADAILDGDDRVERPSVELVSRGLMARDRLPPAGVVELAVLEGDARALPVQGPLDARHEYLSLALAHPDTPRARELAKRLAVVGAGDDLVAVAAALEELAAGATIPPEAPRDLLARNPADPLLAATALRLAERVGDQDVARRARETLTALGRKPGADVD
ncbi:MAG TPA: hypothetical protein VF765_38165 [Polyangiaceae bacterium]